MASIAIIAVMRMIRLCLRVRILYCFFICLGVIGYFVGIGSGLLLSPDAREAASGDIVSDPEGAAGLADGEGGHSGRIGEAEMGGAGGGIVDVAILADSLERL